MKYKGYTIHTSERDSGWRWTFTDPIGSFSYASMRYCESESDACNDAIEAVDADIEGCAIYFSKPKPVKNTNRLLRIAALTFMWVQMLCALAYSVLQNPIVKTFLTR